MGNSVFPSQYDGYAQLRIVQDGVDEIIASDPNSLRSSILAIEYTLGLNPQGSSGTVSARLDSLNDAYALIVAHIANPYDAHEASAIGITDAGDYFISDNVEGALQELGGLITQQPNEMGEDSTVIPNSAIPSFYGGYGTLAIFNPSAPTIQQSNQPSNIQGLTVLGISSATPDGSGTLTLVTSGSSPTVQWQAPGDSSPGPVTNISAINTTGQTVNVPSSTPSKVIRLGSNGVTLSANAPLTDNFLIYALQAVDGYFADLTAGSGGFVPTNFITTTAISDTATSNNQFVITGTIFPADQGTLVLQGKLRSSSEFSPLAVLDLASVFTEADRSTNQQIYSPSYTMFDTITLFDRYPVQESYPEINEDGYAIYSGYAQNFSDYQIAKYLIPASSNYPVGGLLTPPTNNSTVDNDVIAYRMLHFKSGVTNFSGDPDQTEIYGIMDPIGGGNPNGDNTVRASNIFVDNAASRPSIAQTGFTNQNTATNEEVIPKVISGIHYYNGNQDYFYLDTIINGAFENTFVLNSLLNYTTDSLYFPLGQNINMTQLTNIGGENFSATSNIPNFTDPAYYMINSSYNDTSYLYPASNSFSVRARVSAYAIDPFGAGATVDSYGLPGPILINSYPTITATPSIEYFVDENYRIGTAENFASLFTANQFSTSNAWNSSAPLNPGSLQVGGQGIDGITSANVGATPYIPGLIFPQENYTLSSIRPSQINIDGYDYSNASYQVNSTYQRAFTLNSTLSEGILQITSSGLSPLSFNDFYYGNNNRLLKIEICIPGVTGLLDISKLFSTGQIGTPGDDGAGFGCLDAKPFVDTPGFQSLPFTFGEFNNGSSGDMIAVRVTYFSGQFASAKNIILTKLQLLPTALD